MCRPVWKLSSQSSSEIRKSNLLQCPFTELCRARRMSTWHWRWCLSKQLHAHPLQGWSCEHVSLQQSSRLCWHLPDVWGHSSRWLEDIYSMPWVKERFKSTNTCQQMQKFFCFLLYNSYLIASGLHTNHIGLWNIFHYYFEKIFKEHIFMTV